MRSYAGKKTGVCAVACCILVCAFGCGGLKGEFGFKRPHEDRFKKIEGIPEFVTGETIDWAYSFNDFKGEHVVGVTLMKKELVWVDVLVKSHTINESKKVIHGAFENLEEGHYRLILTEKGKSIEEKEFLVYGETEEESFE